MRIKGYFKAKNSFVAEVTFKESNHLFHIGKGFESINELDEVKKSFEDTYFVELWKNDIRTLSPAKKGALKRVANINPSLQYYSILLACKFSGKLRKKTDRKKETKSFR